MNELFSLSGVDFGGILFYDGIKINNGRATFIVGESGAGKSTLLKLLNVSLSANSGSILYNGRDISSYDTISLRREVLLVSQGVFLFDKTVRENFQEFYALRGEPLPNDMHMLKYLNLCRADFPLDSECQTLSGGERQRVYIAIFLSFMPKVLMLDEPTSALDDATAIEVMSNIKTFCKGQGISLVCISHSVEISKRFADDVIRLKKGKDNG